MGFTGGAKLQAILKDTAKKLGEGKTLRVGFLESIQYPDAAGTSVAQVAFWQEYGTATIPPRPFFRTMIAKKEASWGGVLAKNLKATSNDADAALKLVGSVIKDQLQTSIIEMDSPALSPITVMLRGMRRNNPSLVVTGATVGQAAARVAAGKTNYGASSTPLIDSGLMQSDRGVSFDIEDGL